MDFAAQQQVYLAILGGVMSRGARNSPGSAPNDVPSAHDWMTLIDAQMAYRLAWANLFREIDVVIAPNFGAVVDGTLLPDQISALWRTRPDPPLPLMIGSTSNEANVFGLMGFDAAVLKARFGIDLDAVRPAYPGVEGAELLRQVQTDFIFTSAVFGMARLADLESTRRHARDAGVMRDYGFGNASHMASANNGNAVLLYVMKCDLSVLSERVHQTPDSRWFDFSQETAFARRGSSLARPASRTASVRHRRWLDIHTPRT